MIAMMTKGAKMSAEEVQQWFITKWHPRHKHL
jgi:hypothetical protein